MKKLLITFFAAVIMCVLPYTAAYADDGAEFDLYYDFEDYSAAVGSKTMPGKDWGYEANNGSRHRFGSYYDSETGNTALKIIKYGEPLLWFGRNVKEGKLHVSFDIKVVGSGRNCMPLFYDGRMADDAYSLDHVDGCVSKIGFFNSPEGGFRWYQLDPGTQNESSMIGWTAQTSSIVIEPDKWYRIDVVTTEISAGDACAYYYIDGRQVNATPVYFAASKGFKALAFRCEGDSTDEADCILIDNVRASRFFGEEGIKGTITGSSQVPLENGTLSVRLSENVDAGMLVPEKITIKNSATGAQITGFDVIDARSDSFGIKFTETLAPGNYTLMLDSSITGGVLGISMKKAVEFRTEYQTKSVFMTFADLNFNDYGYLPSAENTSAVSGEEDNSTLPDGWRNIGKAENTYAQAVPGKSGESGDMAFGFVNPVKGPRTPTRFIYEFEEPIAALSEYTVTFDVKRSNVQWYMYLLEDGDNDSSKDGYNENVAVSVENTAGNMYYAGARTSTRTTKISELVTESDKWHSVRLRVVPQLNDKTKYIISLDGGKEYEFKVNRDFDKNDTVGIGFGYLQSRNGDGYVYIDNVKVESSMTVVYPEVESVTYITYDDTETDSTDNMTTLLKEIRVGFNTTVDDKSAKAAVSLSGGQALKYGIDIENKNGKSTAVIKISSLLEKGTVYNLNVKDGIKSKFTDTVVSVVTLNKKLTTKRDTSFRFYESVVDETLGKYYAKFVKNNNASGKYTVAVAGYKDVEKEIDGEKVSVPYLVGVKCIPFEVSEGTKGITELETALDFGESCERYETFFWTYPEQHTVTLGELNSIE